MTNSGFDAFISYSHAVDGPLAKSLQRTMRRLGRRWYRPSTLRVFRDDTTLAASPDLWRSIEQALLASRTFVLFASPQAAESPWVQREVLRWQEERSPDSFLIVLTGGEAVWDSDTDDFDWRLTTALPQQLRGWFDAEPLWVDLRTDRGRRELRGHAATITAAIRGIPKDELLADDSRQQRRLVGVLSSLLVVSLAATAIAVGQRGTAIEARDHADQQARMALSRALAAESNTRSQEDPQLAAQFATAAYGVSPTLEANVAITRQQDQNRHVDRYVYRGTDQISSKRGASEPMHAHAQLSADGSLLAYAVPDEPEVVLWSTRTDGEIGRLRIRTTPHAGFPVSTFDLAMDANGRLLAADDGENVQLWNLRTRKLVRTFPHQSGKSSELAISPDGRWIARTSVFQVQTRLQVWRSDTGEEFPVPQSGQPRSTGVAFGPDDRLYSLSVDGLRALDLKSGQETVQVPVDLRSTLPFGVARTGSRVALAIAGRVEIWDLDTRSLLVSRPEPEGRFIDLAVSDDGMAVVGTTLDARVVHVDMRSGATTPLGRHRAEAGEVSAAGDGSAVASVGGGGDVLLSTPLDGRTLATATPPGHGADDIVSAVAISKRGDLAAVARQGGGVELWELPGLRLRTRLPDSVTAGSSTALAISDDGHRLAVVSGPRITVADAESGRIVATTEATESVGLARGDNVAFEPDGRLLVAHPDGPIVVSPETGDEGQRLPARADSPFPAVFAKSADGAVAAVITDIGVESEVELWARRNSRYEHIARVRVDANVRYVALDATGNRMSLLDVDGRVIIVDVDSRRQRALSVPGAGANGSLAFTPDGKTLLHSDHAFDGIAQIDVASGVLLGIWRHTDSRADLELVLDGVVDVGPNNNALTATREGGLVLWQVGPQVARNRLCRIAGPLPGDQRDRYSSGMDVGSGCPR